MIKDDVLFVKELLLWCNCSIQNQGKKPSFEILAFEAFLHKLKKNLLKLYIIIEIFLKWGILQKYQIFQK